MRLFNLIPIWFKANFLEHSLQKVFEKKKKKKKDTQKYNLSTSLKVVPFAGFPQ